MDWVVSVGARLVRTGWLVRAPIGIYKAGAGHVLGSRFVMLEHVGRKSGSTRHVVLEVFNHPAPDIYCMWLPPATEGNPNGCATSRSTRAYAYTSPAAGPYLQPLVSSTSRKPTGSSPPIETATPAYGRRSSPCSKRPWQPHHRHQ